MTAEVIIADGFVGIVVLMIVGGLVMAFRSGGKDEKLDQAEGDAREATKQVRRRTDPVLPNRDYYERLRRAQERLARLRNRAAERRGGGGADDGGSEGVSD